MCVVLGSPVAGFMLPKLHVIIPLFYFILSVHSSLSLFEQLLYSYKL